MDEELKKYLDEKFAAIDGKFAGIDGRFAAIDGKFAAIDGRFAAIDARFASMERLIEDTSASLQREIGTVQETLVGIQRRLDRQGGLIQTGTRQITRLSEWSEKVDVSLEDLTARVNTLESRRQEGPS